MKFVVGILVGALLYYVFAERKKASGKLIIDLSETSTQPIVFKFYESLNEIYTKRCVIFTVEVLEDDSLN